MKKLKYFIVPLMLFSLILIGGMCEKESSRSRDKDDEEQEEQEEEYPDAFPDYLIYPGSTVGDKQEVDMESYVILDIVFWSDDSPAQISAWYLKQLNDNGYEILANNIATEDGGGLMAGEGIIQARKEGYVGLQLHIYYNLVAENVKIEILYNYI